MNTYRFEAEIVRTDAVPDEVVRERVYGNVRVTAEWPRELSVPEIRAAVEVRGDVDRADAPAYVELFYHDLFLLANLAVPGSFGGTVTVSGGELRVRELAFSPHVFEGASGLARLPMEQVTAWYDGLQLGTRQRATDGASAALFQLLHLSRKEEDEQESILRLAGATEALLGRPDSLRRLFELSDDIAQRRTPVFHPMHDDALDPSVEDATSEWVDVADQAASAVVRALQEQIRTLEVRG
jgi:hypothetical protein